MVESLSLNEPRREKTGFLHICENKDADQLRGNREYDPSTSKIRNFKLLSIFYGCIARFVSDLVGNPEDQFSHNEAQI